MDINKYIMNILLRKEVLMSNDYEEIELELDDTTIELINDVQNKLGGVSVDEAINYLLELGYNEYLKSKLKDTE